MIRVLLADDHGLIREGLSRLLGSVADIEVVAAAGDGSPASTGPT
jgi:DNA-binding NarL/FixJ family response regulator